MLIGPLLNNRHNISSMKQNKVHKQIKTNLRQLSKFSARLVERANSQYHRIECVIQNHNAVKPRNRLADSEKNSTLMQSRLVQTETRCVIFF